MVAVVTQLRGSKHHKNDSFSTQSPQMIIIQFAPEQHPVGTAHMLYLVDASIPGKSEDPLGAVLLVDGLFHQQAVGGIQVPKQTMAGSRGIGVELKDVLICPFLNQCTLYSRPHKPV